MNENKVPSNESTFWITKALQLPTKIKLNISDVYSSSSSIELLEFTDDEGITVTQMEESNIKIITTGAYLLIQIIGDKNNSSKYKYIGIAQGDVEEDGDIKVMFLRWIDDSGINFQVKENDVSYIKFDEVLGILKNPSLKWKVTEYFISLTQLLMHMKNKFLRNE